MINELIDGYKSVKRDFDFVDELKGRWHPELVLHDEEFSQRLDEMISNWKHNDKRGALFFLGECSYFFFHPVRYVTGDYHRNTELIIEAYKERMKGLER